ncbi:hypothetical protein G53_00078 [Escherichia phage vB_EcoM_G53]|nr:hypothetical protein G53_00078 [Escherichia phage vB_EcoM_G53]
MNFYGYVFYALQEAVNDAVRLMGLEYPSQWLFVASMYGNFF